jgi:cell division protein FtsN
VLALIAVVFWQVYSSSRAPGDTPQVVENNGSFKAPGDPAETAPVVGSDLDKGVFDAASGASAPALEVQPTSPAEAPMLTDGSAAPAAVAPAPLPVPAATPPPRQVAAATPTKPAATTATVKPAAPAPAPKPVPIVTKIATPAKAPAPAAPKPVPVPVSASAFAAQLGSFKDRASADTALARFRASGLSGPVSIVAADLGAKGTWYRIRATGFESRTEVDVFCGKARSAGAQCIPASR